MILLGDRVPMFKLRAHRGMLMAAFLVLVMGGLLSLYFYSEDAYCTGACRGPLVLIFTVGITLMLLIAATSRFWFKHLWHHRPGYKRG
jgi:hypothetical protein